MADSSEKKEIRTHLFLIIVALITISFIGLIHSFLMATFWAVILSLIFYQLFEFFFRKWKRRNLASIITVIIVIFVVVIPVTLLTIALVDQSQQLIEQYRNGSFDTQGAISFVENRLPGIQNFLQSIGVDPVEVENQIRNTAIELTKGLANRALGITQDTVTMMIQFSLMLYLMYFFLRDGEEIVNSIVNTIPISNQKERNLINRFNMTAKATLKGTLIVAIIQGNMGGILFWAVGIPAPVLWGVLMTILSLLPVGGSGIVWIPAAIIFFLKGEIVTALIIIGVGSLLIALVDNLLRPILVGRDTKMPDYLILLTTLGGITWFGLSGFIIGPVIASLFLSVWQMMSEDYGGKLP